VPEPIVESLAASLKLALAQITEANGYQTTVSAVYRPARLGKWSEQDSAIVLKQGDREESDEPAAESRTTFWMPFQMHLLVKKDDSDETPTDTYVNRFAADVEKQLLANEGAAWKVTGVLNWDLTGPVPLPDAAACDGATLTLRVLIRHQYGDPYTP
jgi:hypothetical protein